MSTNSFVQQRRGMGVILGLLIASLALVAFAVFASPANAQQPTPGHLDYYCQYTGGPAPYRATIYNANSSVFHREDRVAQVENPRNRTQVNAYCRTLSDPYADATVSGGFISTETKCKAGFWVDSSGWPADYLVWARFTSANAAPGVIGDLGDITKPVNEFSRFDLPEGTERVSYRLIRPDRSLAQVLVDHSPQMACLALPEATINATCEAVNVELLRMPSAVNRVVVRFNGEVIHEAELTGPVLRREFALPGESGQVEVTVYYRDGTVYMQRTAEVVCSSTPPVDPPPVEEPPVEQPPVEQPPVMPPPSVTPPPSAVVTPPPVVVQQQQQVQVQQVSRTRLRVTKVGPARVRPGRTLTYTIRVRNTGRVAARNVVLTDVQPRDLVFVRSSRGARVVRGRIVVRVGNLPRGATRTVRLVFRLAPSARGVRVNTVTATAANASRATARHRTAVVRVKARVVVPKVTG